MADGGDLLRRWEDGEINALQFCEQAAEAIRGLLGQLEAAESWDGVMRYIDKTYPADIFDGSSGDPGPRIVVLMRENGNLARQLDAARTALTAINNTVTAGRGDAMWRLRTTEYDALAGLYQAWTVIANARDWLLDDKQAAEWRGAAERWRDNVFHPALDAVSERPNE
jgi:hypothetical protein